MLSRFATICLFTASVLFFVASGLEANPEQHIPLAMNGALYLSVGLIRLHLQEK